MKDRRFHILWSVVCGFGWVLLALLWARSYWATDHIYVRLPGFREFSAWDARGELFLWTNNLRRHESQYTCGVLRIRSWPIGDFPERAVKFDYSLLDYGEACGLPFWFAVGSAVLVAGVPWVRLPKCVERRSFLFGVLGTLVLVFLAFGLFAKVLNDIDTPWPRVPEEDSRESIPDRPRREENRLSRNMRSATQLHERAGDLE